MLNQPLAELDLGAPRGLFCLVIMRQLTVRKMMDPSVKIDKDE
jgi:hypothetical protein